MDIQVLCIGTWLEVAEKNKIFEKQDMASVISENEMKYVYTQLKQLAETHIDPRSRNICKVLANRMAQKLTNKLLCNGASFYSYVSAMGMCKKRTVFYRLK